MCYKNNNIFAVIRGNGRYSTNTPATIITDNRKRQITRFNHTAVAYIGTLMLRFVNYAKTSAIKPLVSLIDGGVQGHK